MLPHKPDSTPDKSKDELQRLLQEALRRKRPRRVRLALASMLVALGLLALLAWLFSPKDEPPRLTVVAFDDLGVAGGEVMLQGRLEASADAHVTLAGKDMVFVDDQSFSAPDKVVKEVVVKTGSHGETSCQWTFPPEADHGDFILRQIGEKFHPGMEDRGRIIFRPSATPLCLVQIDDTLTQGKDQAWRKDNSQDIIPVPGAAEALQQAKENGYEIVYLAVAADRPTLYKKMVGWVRYRSAVGSPPIPTGAVLSRFTLPWADQDHRPWQKTAELLAKRFILPKAEDSAKHFAIAGTIDVAQQFHAAGLRTLYLGAGDDLPGDVQRMPGWEEVRHWLEK
jgi:hypothetical protein